MLRSFFYLAPGITVIFVVVLYFLKWWYRHEFGIVPQLSSPAELHLRKEIDIWRDTARCLTSSSPEERQVKEMLLSYVSRLQIQANIVPSSSASVADLSTQSGLLLSSSKEAPTDSQLRGLQELKNECRIHDRRLFVMCSLVLTLVVGLFFLENFISRWVHLPLAWVALLGAILLMVLADVQDISAVLHKVEWGTLLFFGALFVLVEGVDKLGLVDLIGETLSHIISHVHEDSRLLAAVVMLIWVSATASAIIDSIPYTTAMLPIVIQLSQDASLRLPLKPMVLSLALGTGLGSNGTLLGATANLVMAGLAEQYGFPVGFVKFAKVGFPVMFVSSLVGTVYLVIVFGALKLGTEL